MKHVRFVFYGFCSVAALGLTLILASCGGEDDTPEALTLVSLNAGDADLNGATNPTGVSPSAAISGIFSTDLDPASADANVSLVSEFDGSEVEIEVAVGGRSLTITPASDLQGASLYVLTIGAGLKSAGGATLGADITRSFTTAGTFTPENVVAHWTFEGNADDMVGDFDATEEVAITYTDSRKEAAGTAATFDGDASIIEVPNADELMNREEFSLSFWVKTNSTGHVNENGDPAGHFVMGLGAFHGFQVEISSGYNNIKIPATMEYGDGSTGTGGDLFWNGDGLTKDNGGYQGTTINKSSSDLPGLLKDKWAHIVYVFSGSGKFRELYINGDLKKRQDLTLWPSTEKEPTAVGLKFNSSAADVENVLAFGFVQSRGGLLWDNEPWGNYAVATSNHFKGQLDDVRVFDAALSEDEIKMMYDSEKP